MKNEPKFKFKFGFNDNLTETCLILTSSDGSRINPDDYIEGIELWLEECRNKAHEMFRHTPEHEDNTDLN